MNLKNNQYFNISSSIIYQFFTAIIPLILLPWFALKLGTEKMGVYALVVSMVSLFTILIDYGFNIYSTNFIIKNKFNIDIIFSHFLSVSIVRLINLFCLFSTIFILSFFFKIIANNFLSFSIGFIYLLGNILGPIWLYQSFSKLGFYSVGNILLKIIFLIPIFFFIHSPDDLNISIFLWSMPSFIFGIFSLHFTIRNFFMNVNYSNIKIEIKNNYQEPFLLFISNLYISAYTSATTLISGFFLSPTEVSNFFIADRVIRGSSLLLTPISQIVYVKSHEMFLKSITFYRTYIFNLFKYSFLFLIMSFFIFISSDFVINFLFKNKYSQAIILIKIMSLIPFFVSLSNILGTQILLVQSRYKEFSFKVGIISIFNLFIFTLFTKIFGLHGAAFSCLIAEFSVIIILRKSFKYL